MILFLFVLYTQEPIEIDGQLFTIPPLEELVPGKDNPFVDKMKQVIKSKDKEKIRKMMRGLVRIEDPLLNPQVQADLPDCGVPNTIKLEDGTCKCVDGYIYEGDILSKGCWKCPDCHQNATCKSPGECICQSGLIGNGISECSAPEPVLLNATLNSKLIEFSFVRPEIYVPSEIYCRCGMVEMPGNFTNSTHGFCKSILEDKPQFVSISFDRNQWSSPRILIDVTPKFNFIGLIFFVLIFAVITIIYVVIRARNGKESKSESMQPFIPAGEKKKEDLARRRDITL